MTTGYQQRGRGTAKLALVGAAVAALGLAGCTNPYSPGQRALGGGALGAGAGAALGAVTGGSPAAGALIGGGIGALGGALTTPQRPQGSYYRRGGYSGYRSPPGYNNGAPPPPPPGYGPPPPPPPPPGSGY